MKNALADKAPWNALDLEVNTLQYSADGRWLAMTAADGTLWFYAMAHNRWICALLGHGEILFGQFAPDSRYYLATVAEGDVLLVDMSLILSDHLIQ